MSLGKSRFEHFWNNSWWLSLFIFIIFFIIPFSLIHRFVDFSFAIAPFSILISSLFANLSVLTFQNYRRWHLFGLILRETSFQHFIIGFFLPFFLFLPILIFLFFQGITFNFVPPKDLLFYLYFIGFSATNEELIFRGVLFQRLIDKKGEFFAIAISSIVFSLGHLWNPHFSFISFLNIFLAGVFFGVAYIKTQMLWLPIGFHFGWNFWQKLILDSPVSGLQWGDSLINTKITQLNEILFGGGFGIEGGMICTLLLIIAIFIVSKFFVPVPEIVSKILREKYCSQLE